DKINSFFIPPSGKFENPFFLNGKELDIAQVDTGSTPFYKTNFLTDYALNVMEEEINNERPFFLYLPYHTAHYPLQALPEDIEKYRGTYKKGWDVLRQERFERMKKMGIIPRHTVLSPPEDNINKFRGHPKGDEDIRANIPKYRFWDSLSNKEQDDLDLEMAVFAAMVDCMDQNIGRIISKLEETGQLDNTLIIYLSDNGSCPYDSNRDFEVPPGPANSYRTLSAAWANTGNTPFRLFKQFGHSGGSQTQFIVHWPGQVEKGTLTNQTGHVVDIFPTFLDLINRMDPSMGKPPYPLDGTSLLPVFEGKTRKVPEYMVSGMEKFRMYQRDNYKLVRANNENWELYDMDKDPTEINNLAADMPEKVIEMDSLYIEWTKTHKKRR
ncbi:MAG: sulfatase-like hydrolase/transferase, partial [Cyclobacteriaceae bacterium]|nr:sulfatase-like hydrolase/transferase [Cyclobacteriaceae bacterium]